MKVAIVIPAYNEAGSIAEVTASVRDYGSVVVVDDGSTDATAEMAAGAGAAVVSHGANRGYDAAIASGLSKGSDMGADILVTFDADGQLDARAIPAALDAFADPSVQLVLGVRDSGAARLSEVLFNLYARLRFGAPDILCGLKAVRSGAYLANRGRTESASVNTALALALLRQGAGHALVPVAVKPREGRSRFGGGLRANLRIARALADALRNDLFRSRHGREPR